MIPVRTLEELGAAGLGAWLRPVADLLRPYSTPVDSLAGSFFRPGAPVFLARAPGRLDVMGGIADYSGATVLQLPLANATFALAQATDVPEIEIVSLRNDGPDRFVLPIETLRSARLRTPQALSGWFAERPDQAWAAYPTGVLQQCLTRVEAPGGVRLLIMTQVPEGRGVSSSAALEVSTFAALAARYSLTVPPEEMAAQCQAVENQVVGAACGIMDQMTSACGQADRLLRLRCRPVLVEGHLPIPEGYRFYGIDSGIRHAVTGADYTTVRTAAFMGYRMIAETCGFRVEREGPRFRIEDPKWDGALANLTVDEFVTHFRDALPAQMLGAEFLARYGGTTDAVTTVLPERTYPVRAATAHPIYENARIRRFAELLAALPSAPAVAEQMGELMYGSHESYGACGLGSPGVDRLVAMVREAGPAAGLFGARITGGGSGGTVAVLGRADAEEKVREIARRYQEEAGRQVSVFTDSGPGAAEFGVVRLDFEQLVGEIV